MIETMSGLGLAERRAVIAGVGGIGSACAEALLFHGARVVAIDSDAGRLEALHQRTEAPGHRLHCVKADLTTPSACRDAAAQAAEYLGGIDVFVHAVGLNSRVPVLDVGDDEWQAILTLNLSSGFWLGQAVGRLMCAAGYGRIVFLSSVSGMLAHGRHGPYAASKGGLNQLLRVMAREWAPDGVTVNAVAPGYTETALTGDYLAQPGVREEMVRLVPAGRLGSTADVVGPVLFLASDLASFVTGHILYVDGGRVLV